MRLHIFIVTFFLTLICVFGMAALVLYTYRSVNISTRVDEAKSYCTKVANRISTTGYMNVQTNTDVSNQLVRTADIYEGRIILVNNRLKVIADTYDTETGKTLISEEVVRCLGGTSISTYYDKVRQYAELTLPITDNETKEIIGVIIVRISLSSIYKSFNTFSKFIWIIATFIGALLMVFSLIYSFRMTIPMRKIIESIEHISHGYMEDKVSIKGFYEITKISDAFNVMLDRMNKLEASRQEFVSNVSHELKTPMTSMKVLADSLLSQEHAPEELYREFLTDINEEIERENKVISDLLSLVKLDRKEGEMNVADTNINELLNVILRRLKPIAEQTDIELIYESIRPVVAEVDEVKLTLAISNLIENAIKYNVKNGWVKVLLNADHKYFQISVSDSGIGISEDEIPHIFDRFYRVDKARARSTGGTGLGLAIVKNIVLMHKGTIRVYSRENVGTTFTIRIPLSYIV